MELTSSGLSHTFVNYIKKPDELDDEDALPTILTKGKYFQSLYDVYEASYPAKYRENKFKDFYQGLHFSTLDIVLPDSSSSSKNGGVQYKVIDHLGVTVYSQFYPFNLPFSASSTATATSHCSNSSRQDFTYSADGTLGYQCTPQWGEEQPMEYFLHVFCMAFYMFLVFALPALTVCWLIFASFYYVWFITEEKRRARIEAMHDKKGN